MQFPEVLTVSHDDGSCDDPEEQGVDSVEDEPVVGGESHGDDDGEESCRACVH